MAHGYLALVLHAHLPFVRHPEHARHLEERWFYEALVECYLPLLDAFDRMADEGVPFALTMSVTPPLAAMMSDDLLRRRFHEHLARLEAPGGARDEAPLRRRAVRADRHVLSRPLRATCARVWDRHGGDVLSGLVRHWDAGRLELITCSATHCYLPGMLPAREGIRPQLALGVTGFERIVGRTPTGAWLAECAYHPSFDAEIARAGIRFTVLDTHGILHARPRPPFGVHAPICSPSGVAFFGRDVESSRQVWSRDEGYPGDAYYRDFYRDIGFDLPEADLMGEVVGDGSRLMTGLKYYRITGKDMEKEPYQPGVARERAWEHAGNFVFNRAKQIERAGSERMPAPPIVVAPYDAELYGHWWFEGPIFLEAVFRRLREVSGRRRADHAPAVPRSAPRDRRGDAERQLVGRRRLRRGLGRPRGGLDVAARAPRDALRALARRAHRHADGRRGQALDQSIRELLLLQSSDWPFILKTGTATRYAEARIRAHVHRLRHLGHLVETGAIEGTDAAWLDDLCKRDNFLASLSRRRAAQLVRLRPHPRSVRGAAPQPAGSGRTWC